jgi:hypothetical protein
MAATMAAAAAVAAGTPREAGAATFPLLDPGFDTYLAGTTTPVPDDRALGIGNGGIVNAILQVASTAADSGQRADTPAGWNTAESTLRFRDDVEFTTAKGSTMAAVAYGTSGVGVFSQNLGVAAQPNATYTLSIQVSDRNSIPLTGGTDVTAIAADIGLLLIADYLGPNQVVLPSSTTFVPPANGGTSLMTTVVATGATVPAGNLTFYVYANGNNNQGIGNTHTFFDNAALDVVPEPAGFLALLGVAAAAVAAPRRRQRV